MTIHIPDDLALSLAGIAAIENRSVEQIAIERLRSMLEPPASPGELLATLRALPHPSASAVDDLDAAIATSRLPVRDDGIFDAWPLK